MESVKYCPNRVAMQMTTEVPGPFSQEAAQCPPECPGPIEVERSRFSLMRIVVGVDTKSICVGQRQDAELSDFPTQAS